MDNVNDSDKSFYDLKALSIHQAKVSNDRMSVVQAIIGVKIVRLGFIKAMYIYLKYHSLKYFSEVMFLLM